MTVVPLEMPYKREDGRCELCGSTANKLKRVVLRESSGTAMKSYKCPRVAYICDAHDGADGPILKAPHSSMADGTSLKKPQTETLW